MGVELKVLSPCPGCTERWLPYQWSDSEIEYAVAPGRRVEMTDVEDNTIVEAFYPHPACFRHAPFVGESELKPGYLSPLVQQDRLELPPHWPTISVAVGKYADMPTEEPLVGQGVDASPELADVKARMEFLERMATYLPPRAKVTWGRASELLGALLPVGDAEKDRYWIETEAGALLPLEYSVEWSRCRVPDPVVRADSTGMAAHPDRAEAIRIGTAECLERAGIVRTWRRGIEVVIDTETFPVSVRPFTVPIAEMGYRIFAFSDEPVPGFTACTIVLRREKDTGPSLLVCSGGEWSSEGALLKGLREAYGQLVHAIDIWPKVQAQTAPRSYSQFFYYLREENAARLMDHWGISRAKSIAFRATPFAPREVDVSVVERGNVLTDSLGIHVVHVITPALMETCRWEIQRTPDLPYPYA